MARHASLLSQLIALFGRIEFNRIVLIGSLLNTSPSAILRGSTIHFKNCRSLPSHQ